MDPTSFEEEVVGIPPYYPAFRALFSVPAPVLR